MLRYLVWGMGLVGLLLACERDATKGTLKAGTLITQSTHFDQDTIFWDLTNEQAGLIIDSEEDLILDFQGAVLAGNTFGENPDQHQGTAIKIVTAKKLHLKNAHFRAFQQGLFGDYVEHLILENCSFHFFYRAPLVASTNSESYGIDLIKVDTIRLINTSFQHMDRALELAFVNQIEVDRSKFQWLRQGALRVDQASNISLTNSQFLYLGLPGEQNRTFDLPALDTDLQANYFAHLFGEVFFDLKEKSNQAAYLPSLPETEWNKASLDSLLLTSGVTTPELVLLDEWGIYDHRYPKAWFRQTQGASDVFLLTAPPGNWRLTGGAGYDRVIPKTGTFPTTLRAEKTTEADSFQLKFEYLGKPVQRFGKPYQPQGTYQFYAW